MNGPHSLEGRALERGWVLVLWNPLSLTLSHEGRGDFAKNYVRGPHSLERKGDVKNFKVMAMQNALIRFIGVLVFLIGLGLCYVGGAGLLNHFSLEKNSSTTEARVTNKGTQRSRRTGISYLVKYEFHLPEDSTVYSFADETGRKDLWVSLDEDDWNQLNVGDFLPVQYEEKNPWNNSPVNRGGQPLGDVIAGFVMGVFLALIGFLVMAMKKPFGTIKKPA